MRKLLIPVFLFTLTFSSAARAAEAVPEEKTPEEQLEQAHAEKVREIEKMRAEMEKKMAGLAATPVSLPKKHGENKEKINLEEKKTRKTQAQLEEEWKAELKAKHEKEAADAQAYAAEKKAGQEKARRSEKDGL